MTALNALGRVVMVLLAATLLIGGIAIAVSGCAWFTPAKFADIGVIVDCVLSNENKPVAEIAVVCGLEDEKQIVDILSAHRTAEMRSPSSSTQTQAPAGNGEITIPTTRAATSTMRPITTAPANIPALRSGNSRCTTSRQRDCRTR